LQEIEGWIFRVKDFHGELVWDGKVVNI
jgi:hypothetical protein